MYVIKTITLNPEIVNWATYSFKANLNFVKTSGEVESHKRPFSKYFYFSIEFKNLVFSYAIFYIAKVLPIFLLKYIAYLLTITCTKRVSVEQYICFRIYIKP
jgi:hypothetical protein